MADEQKPVLPTSGTPDAGSNETEQKTTEEATPKPFDADAFRSELEEVRSSAATKAEIEDLRRKAGHVPGLQSEIATLRTELDGRKGDKDRIDALERMVMDLLPSDEADRVRAAREEQDRLSGMETRLRDEFRSALPKQEEKTEDAVDPRAAAAKAAADAATTRIHTYATERGIDPTEIPGEVYQRAQIESNNDFVQAAEIVAAWVDEQAEARNAAARRETRAADASGGDPVTRAGGNGQYDLNTLAGLSQARAANAINSEQFMEGWRKLRGGI